MNPKKIKPILSSHVSIQEREDSQLFYKKYHKFVTSFALDNKQTDPFDRDFYSPLPPFSHVKKSKYTKSVKRLRLILRYDEDYDGNEISYNSSFVKMFPDVKCLSMHNCSISENRLIGSLAIWLKRAKRIRKISCQNNVDTFENYGDYEDKKHSKQFVRVFRKGKLEELNVYGEYPDLFAEYASQFPMINQLRYISSNYIDERISKPYYVRKIWFRWNYEKHWRINPEDHY